MPECHLHTSPPSHLGQFFYHTDACAALLLQRLLDALLSVLLIRKRLGQVVRLAIEAGVHEEAVHVGPQEGSADEVHAAKLG